MNFIIKTIIKAAFAVFFLAALTLPAYARKGCPKANLSEDQKAAVKTMRQDFRAAAEGKSREEKRALKAELHQKILDTVPVSDEQRAALAKCQERKKRGCPEANLSEEQKTAKRALRKEFRAAAEGKSREEKRALKAELSQKILDTIPASDAQRAALAECQERRKNHRRGNQ